MFSRAEPTPQKVADFLAGQQGVGFSYPELCCSLRSSPAGYHIDHNRIQVGCGEAVFEAAVSALLNWSMFPASWTRIEPAGAPVVMGQVVAMIARAYGVWCLNGCRIVYLLDETNPVRRLGFAYGTLPEHAECGEERFSIELHGNGQVWYDLRACSKPGHRLPRIAWPIARRLQRRFVRDSQTAMRLAVERAPTPRVPSSERFQTRQFQPTTGP